MKFEVQQIVTNISRPFTHYLCTF